MRIAYFERISYKCAVTESNPLKKQTMKTLFKTLGVLIYAGLALTLPASAVLVDYSVDGVAAQQFASPVTPPADAPWGVSGYPGDTVALESYKGTFDLTVGTTTQKLNSLLWSVNYTYGGTATDPNVWNDVSFTLSAGRTLHIGDGTALLDQSGSLTAGWDNDYLGLSEGSTVTLFTQGYQIDITPLAVPASGASNFDGNNPWEQPAQDIYARFVVTEAPGGLVAAPEPGSILALAGLALISCGSPVVSRLRSKK